MPDGFRLFVLFQDFRRYIVSRSTYSISPLALIYFGCQAKISYFKLHVLIDEQITKLDIPVNDIVLVDMLETKSQMVYVVASLFFG
jgi:hypothetical protein